MAYLFDTQYLDENLMKTLDSDTVAHIYNGLDCCVTAEIYNELQSQIEDEEAAVQETYATALDKLAPYTEMTLRGVKVDMRARDETIKYFEARLSDLDRKFQRIMVEVFGGEINWNSHIQVKQLFYTQMGLKPIRKRNTKGVFAPTVNEEALEALQVYFHARPLARFILQMRKIRKSLGFLKTEIDRDGRIRTGYNTAGTNTGRLSSSMSDFGTGTNLQNVDRRLRYPFVADPGFILVNIDLEQADGRNVGADIWNAFYETKGPEFAGAYLDACESGDLHTHVCRMTWPDLEWPDDPAQHKKFCDSITLHGQDSYRQIAKKLGHGTNYYGKPRTMAKHTHTPVHIIENFQASYFKSFPGIPAWHEWVINHVKTSGVLYNLFGRRRYFFGRGDDAATHRKAIAYSPQSSTGEEIDRGIMNLWRNTDSRAVQLLLQVHDSILLQVPFNEHEDLIPLCLDLLKIEIELAGGRKFSVPLDAKVGWNWGDYDYDNPNKNPYGLKAWTGKETRSKPSVTNRLRDYLKIG